MDVGGAVAVVTGGASGIGRASALALAAEGAHVVIADVDRSGSESAVAEIGDRGGEARSIPTDVTDRAQVEGLIEEVIAWKGHCDLFFSNAGVGVGGPPERIPLEDWGWVMDVNVWPHVWAVRKVLPHMLERGKGYLVHTASAAGLIGVPSLAPYAMSKFAIVGLAESLAIYCSGRGVAVSVLCPMVVDTNIIDASRMTPDRELDEETEERVTEIQRSQFKATGIPAEAVAEELLDAIRDERFYVFPHPQLKGLLDAKWQDPDGWIRGAAEAFRAQRQAIEDLIASG